MTCLLPGALADDQLRMSRAPAIFLLYSAQPLGMLGGGGDT